MAEALLFSAFGRPVFAEKDVSAKPVSVVSLFPGPFVSISHEKI
jgi:hypothetical protein